ncbi:hypothetical protein Hanom_Chr03g00242921 [Helianthus anomalus]
MANHLHRPPTETFNDHLQDPCNYILDLSIKLSNEKINFIDPTRTGTFKDHRWQCSALHFFCNLI